MEYLQLMIDNGEMCEFVNEIIRLRNNEEQDDAIWQIWLHKINGETYTDFHHRLMCGAPDGTPDAGTLADIVRSSHDSIMNFNPTESGASGGTAAAE